MRLLVLFILVSFFATGQTKVAVLTNKPMAFNLEKINSISKDKNISFEILQDFDYQTLSAFNVIWFKHFDESKITLKQNSALTLYFKNGGGAIADFDIQKTNPKWVWFGKMFGNPISIQSIMAQKDVIAMQSLGKVEVSPMWKMSIQEIAKIKAPKYFKPVLMDLEGNTMAWIGKSEFGNKVYYSSISNDIISADSKEFTDFFIGAVLEVSGKIKSDFSEKDRLPESKNFHIFTLSDSLNQAKNLEFINPNFCIVLCENGEVFNYESKSKILHKLGVFTEFRNALDLTADPEFDSNGYIYAHFKNEKSNVKRLRFFSSTRCESDTFTVESSLPMPNSFVVSLKNESAGLPPYYSGKKFILKDKIEVESLNEEGEVISSEPFVLDFDNEKINAISKNEKGQILVLFDSKLVQITYAQNGGLPLFSDFVYHITNSKIPYKLICQSKNNQKVNIEWEINGVKLKGEMISYALKKNGKYFVKMKAVSMDGQVEVIEKEVVVAK